MEHPNPSLVYRGMRCSLRTVKCMSHARLCRGLSLVAWVATMTLSDVQQNSARANALAATSPVYDVKFEDLGDHHEIILTDRASGKSHVAVRGQTPSEHLGTYSICLGTEDENEKPNWSPDGLYLPYCTSFVDDGIGFAHQVEFVSVNPRAPDCKSIAVPRYAFGGWLPSEPHTAMVSWALDGNWRLDDVSCARRPASLQVRLNLSTTWCEDCVNRWADELQFWPRRKDPELVRSSPEARVSAVLMEAAEDDLIPLSDDRTAYVSIARSTGAKGSFHVRFWLQSDSVQLHPIAAVEVAEGALASPPERLVPMLESIQILGVEPETESE